MLLTRNLLNERFLFRLVEVITSKVLRSPARMTWLIAMVFLCHKWPRVSLVEQELLAHSEHMSSYLLPVLSWVRVTRYLVLCLCFVDRCLYFWTFFFWLLCCLSFFDWRILITTIIVNNSYKINKAINHRSHSFTVHFKPRSWSRQAQKMSSSTDNWNPNHPYFINWISNDKIDIKKL